MRLKRVGDPHEFEVEVIAREGSAVRVRIDGAELSAEVERQPDGGAIIAVHGRRLRVFGARVRNAIMIAAGPALFEFVSPESRATRGAHGLAAPEVTAPMPGKVLKFMVAEGDVVESGQALVVLEAMKMETTLYAESRAMVKKIRAAAGAMVDHGAILIELSPPPADSSANEPPARAS
jgi:biotin carboxyl carrier protein